MSSEILFEGAFMHRDSLGNACVIRPGDVNWMMAGRGIVHSERTPPEVRDANGRTRAHGIQTWVALPRADEEREPSFVHHGAASLPRIELPGVILTVIAGTAYGQRSPVGVFSPTLYVDAQLAAGTAVEVPDEHEQRACYAAQGRVEIAGQAYDAGQFVVLASAAGPVSMRALETSRVMLVGGAPLDGPRHIYWNFVASSRRTFRTSPDV